jgi:hypothetical protein
MEMVSCDDGDYSQPLFWTVYDAESLIQAKSKIFAAFFSASKSLAKYIM